MRKIVLSFALAVLASSVGAVPIVIAIEGDWPVGNPQTHLAIQAEVDSDAVDRSSWDRIGDYSVAKISFNFSRLGDIPSPFELVGDSLQSSLHLYPSAQAGSLGELRFFGRYAQSVTMPNGIAPVDFDLRVNFSNLLDDSLGSLNNNLQVARASFYFSDQIGARSSDFAQLDFSIATRGVPEPASSGLTVLSLAGLGLAHLLSRRRRVNSQMAPSAPWHTGQAT